MDTIASQITSLTIVYSIVYSDTGLFAGNSPGTGEFPAQMASNAENVSIWWRHHGKEDQDGWINLTSDLPIWDLGKVLCVDA